MSDHLNEIARLEKSLILAQGYVEYLTEKIKNERAAYELEKHTTVVDPQEKPCCQAVRLLNENKCTTWRCPVCYTEV
jgi:hypothetical protein